MSDFIFTQKKAPSPRRFSVQTKRVMTIIQDAFVELVVYLPLPRGYSTVSHSTQQPSNLYILNDLFNYNQIKKMLSIFLETQCNYTYDNTNVGGISLII